MKAGTLLLVNSVTADYADERGLRRPPAARAPGATRAHATRIALQASETPRAGPKKIFASGRSGRRGALKLDASASSLPSGRSQNIVRLVAVRSLVRHAEQSAEFAQSAFRARSARPSEERRVVPPCSATPFHPEPATNRERAERSLVRPALPPTHARGARPTSPCLRSHHAAHARPSVRTHGLRRRAGRVV